MGLFQKIDSWMDDKYERRMNKKELINWNKLIKKACKKHFIKNKDILRMYFSIQSDVLKRVNLKEIERSSSKADQKVGLLQEVVNQRVYDLNREFILLLNGEYHNSLHALTRQMIELSIRMIHCRADSSIINKLLDEKKQKLTPFNVIEKLKKSKISFDYVRGIDSDKFLDSIYSWFCYFSNIFHISGISLSQNMWVWKEGDLHSRLYVEKPDLEEGEVLAIFSKRSVVTSEQYRILIHQFYTFSDLVLKELNLIISKNG